jgi:tetratricopeptide (TPR) repeat protein
MYRCGILACLALLAATAPAAAAGRCHGAPPSGEGDAIPIYEGLGNYHRAITTSSPDAQAYFDQGMMLAYAFGRPESVRSFRAASERDPDCALCYWGEAWALGPYQNEEMSDEDAPLAYAAARKAMVRKDSTGEIERALIEAMAVRYVEEPQEERADLDRAYADAMREVARRFPDDLDANALFAEALMILYPWDLYPEGRVRPEGEEAIAVLERVLAADIHHAGACHMYIHAVEESTEPERAAACADLLADGIPLGSHIPHMPSHIYMRIGRYGDGVRANQRAQMVDRKAARGEAVAIYAGHNTDMLCFAAWMDGQSSVALQAARDLGRDGGPEGMLLPLILARFGRWDELAAMSASPKGPLPEGLWQLARGVAFLRTGSEVKADRALGRLAKALDHADPDETFGPKTTDKPIDLLRIAHGILAGEIAAAAGDYDAAVRHLEAAVASEDGLQYSEPEIWPIPSRQVLGAILLEADRPADAQRIYEEELEDHPENGWSLFGLAAALRAQGKDGEADAVEERFERAWARADVALTSSRF